MLKPRKQTIEVKQPAKEVVKCPRCKGNNVEQKLWINVNTLRISDEQGDETSEHFCSDCYENFDI